MKPIKDQTKDILMTRRMVVYGHNQEHKHISVEFFFFFKEIKFYLENRKSSSNLKS